MTNDSLRLKYLSLMLHFLFLLQNMSLVSNDLGKMKDTSVTMYCLTLRKVFLLFLSCYARHCSSFSFLLSFGVENKLHPNIFKCFSLINEDGIQSWNNFMKNFFNKTCLCSSISCWAESLVHKKYPRIIISLNFRL